MFLEVHNYHLSVGHVQIDAIGSSSIFLIGDNDTMVLSSFYDTPPESYTVTNLIPLSLT